MFSYRILLVALMASSCSALAIPAELFSSNTSISTPDMSTTTITETDDYIVSPRPVAPTPTWNPTLFTKLSFPTLPSNGFPNLPRTILLSQLADLLSEGKYMISPRTWGLDKSTSDSPLPGPYERLVTFYTNTGHNGLDKGYVILTPIPTCTNRSGPTSTSTCTSEYEHPLAVEALFIALRTIGALTLGVTVGKLVVLGLQRWKAIRERRQTGPAQQAPQVLP